LAVFPENLTRDWICLGPERSGVTEYEASIFQVGACRLTCYGGCFHCEDWLFHWTVHPSGVCLLSFDVGHTSKSLDCFVWLFLCFGFVGVTVWVVGSVEWVPDRNRRFLRIRSGILDSVLFEHRVVWLTHKIEIFCYAGVAALWWMFAPSNVLPCVTCKFNDRG